MTKKLTLLYFAWVREKTGKSSETMMIPDNITTVGDLMTWLSFQDECYANAFAQADKIKVAVDQDYVSQDTLLHDATEIAFFPPVTGG